MLAKQQTCPKKQDHFSFKLGSKTDALHGKSAALWIGSAGVLRLKKLKDAGLKANSYEVPTHIQIIKMLIKGRADFTISFMPLIRKECEKEKLDCKSLVVLDYPPLAERNKIYLAMNKNIDKNLREEFVTAFKTFQGTEEYLNIIEKYGLKFKK